MTSISGIWYHGTTKKFPHLQLPKRYSPQEQCGFGIHFAKKKEFALLYGHIIYHANLFPTKPLDVTKIYKKGSPEEKVALALSGKNLYYSEGWFAINIDRRHPKTAENILKKFGYDAVRYKAKYMAKGFRSVHRAPDVVTSTPAITMLDPSRIKVIRIETT